LVIFGERPRGGMQFERQRQRRIDQREHIGDRFGDFAPISLLLAPRDGSELVEHLHAELTAGGEERARPIGLAIQLLGIDENVGVEEGAHRSFASSRSKR